MTSDQLTKLSTAFEQPNSKARSDMNPCTVVLGGNEVTFAYTDVRILRLAWSIFKRTCPLNPEEILQFCSEKEHSEDLSKRARTVQERANDLSGKETEPSIFEMELVKMKLRNCRIHDIHPCVLQHYWNPDVDCVHDFLGYRELVHTFDTMDKAHSARKLNSVNFAKSPFEVLEFISKTTENPISPFDLLQISLEPCFTNSVETFELLKESECDGFSISQSQWKNICNRVHDWENDGGKELYQHVVAIYGSQATVVTIVYPQWKLQVNMDSPPTIHHRSIVGCQIKWNKVAPHGGFVTLIFNKRKLERIPDWISKVSFRVDDYLLDIYDDKQTGKRVRSLSEHILDDIRVQEHKRPAVLERWEKSARSRGLVCPYLCRALFPTDGIDTNGFIASRVKTMEDATACGLFEVFKTEFGTEYTSQTLERVLNDDYAATYVVTESGSQIVVAGFILVVFECVFSDGGIGAACMIDTFAVSRKLQGAGIGGKVFHNICRGLAKQHVDRMKDPNKRHVMFAQCLTTKRPRDFWFDKLDDSGICRALLLQASVLCPQRVPLHNNCCARARIYEEIMSDGEE